MIWTKAFWQGAAERAIKTFFQTLVAVCVAGTVGVEFPGLGAIDWVDAASVAGLAAVLSLATSLGNADFTAGEPPGRVGSPEGTSTRDVCAGQPPQRTLRVRHRSPPGSPGRP